MGFSEFANDAGLRLRVWLDELPENGRISGETVRETQVFPAGAMKAVRGRAAVELIQPFGASFHYGLLGGDYERDGGSSLQVTIPIETVGHQELYAESLARDLDVVSVGAMTEYAAGIRSGLDQLGVASRPSGILNITCMAHGEIGSAPAVFGALARALTRALCRSDEPASLDEAMTLLTA